MNRTVIDLDSRLAEIRRLENPLPLIDCDEIEEFDDRMTEHSIRTMFGGWDIYAAPSLADYCRTVPDVLWVTLEPTADAVGWLAEGINDAPAILQRVLDAYCRDGGWEIAREVDDGVLTFTCTAGVTR